MRPNDNWKHITDREYILGLKAGNNSIAESFFYGLCNYTLNDIRRSLFNGMVDYNDLVSELYIYLSANNWHKLDTYAGINGCTLRSWVIRIAWRYFFKQLERLLGKPWQIIGDVALKNNVIPDTDMNIIIDVDATFVRMSNKRYVQILQWMLLWGYDAEEVAEMMNTSPANVYNIKHRAIVQFIKVYNAA